MKTFLLLGLWSGLATAAFAGWQPVTATGGVGVTEAFSDHDRHVVYELELEFAELHAGWAPVVEMSVSAQEAMFLGMGVAWRWEGGTRLGMRLGVAPGAYDSGEGKDLGGHFQIMSFAEGTWRVTEHGRLGLRLSHFSNASLRGTNPGTEILSLTYAVGWR